MPAHRTNPAERAAIARLLLDPPTNGAPVTIHGHTYRYDPAHDRVTRVTNPLELLPGSSAVTRDHERRLPWLLDSHAHMDTRRAFAPLSTLPRE